MKKLLTLLLTLIICTGSLFADGVKIGDLYYILNHEKLTAEVTYKSFNKKAKLGESFNNGWDIQTANIPDSVTYKGKWYRVTSIGKYAFRDCYSLTSVTIPSSITSIESMAFSAFNGRSALKEVHINDLEAWCRISFVDYASNPLHYAHHIYLNGSEIKDLVIPDGIINIKRYAFHICFGLRSVTIPNSVTTIGDWAFRECKNLVSVTIGNRVTHIGEYAFLRCTNLASITFGNSVKHIWRGAFEGCTALASVTIPNDVIDIKQEVFKNCQNLTSVTIPNGVESIGISAFSGCSALSSVKIPNTVTSIGNDAFYKCTGLTSLVIPNSVSSIGKYAFLGCSNLSIYTSSKYYSESLDNGKQRYLVSPEQLVYYYPYSVFAKDYVERKINEWQKKGEFERVADWQQRVNEQTRQEKIQAVLAESQKEYIDFHEKYTNISLLLGKYDAENEVFAMKEYRYGTLYLSVPLSEAQDFKNNWKDKKIKPQMQIYDDEAKLSALTIAMPNGKQYTYRNTDAVSYNLAQVEYDFEPIELDIPKTSPAPKQGQVNITKTTLKADKSAVDSNIPETNASNPNTFAVIYANEDYKNVASVPFAKNDGAVFRKYCQKTLGIPADNIHYVENATFNDMRIQLAWLKDVCDAFEGKASLIVYYAGHGIPDEASKSAYLLPVDGDGRYVQSAYKLDNMYQKLGAMNAKSVTVFMDACFSGSKREEGMLASARGVAIKVKGGQPQGNMVVFSAASGDETAYPNNDEQHGMFTYFLLKKLQETKGDVTLQDLGDYITTNVRQQSIVKNGKSQTPCVTPSASLSTNWKNWKLK